MGKWGEVLGKYVDGKIAAAFKNFSGKSGLQHSGRITVDIDFFVDVQLTIGIQCGRNPLQFRFVKVPGRVLKLIIPKLWKCSCSLFNGSVDVNFKVTGRCTVQPFDACFSTIEGIGLQNFVRKGEINL